MAIATIKVCTSPFEYALTTSSRYWLGTCPDKSAAPLLRISAGSKSGSVVRISSTSLLAKAVWPTATNS
ncbi:hypothetical protein ISF_02923 [Cordyceps fumosorosea ARSEF 2679]|uniref:Uncharacterized protein n=1 Tax=Cordyceps fumosorosea (strain ARSEF 2679) TaxID=1081104 RepID=A0A168B5N7_CORFA|nr:hypothetical protein ISF_02923 [Cordyceps fumosorosea ARSEF 2679]OAA69653.1 hypothetical protein ISF_02923 [Cordyceps fumosorosea ARSEF 2679]